MLGMGNGGPGAIYLFERCLAVGATMSTESSMAPMRQPKTAPGFVVGEVGEVREDGVYAHIHHSIHGTPDEAKDAAEQWAGPPPTGMTGLSG